MASSLFFGTDAFEYTRHTSLYDSTGTYRADWNRQDMDSFSNASNNAFRAWTDSSMRDLGRIANTGFNTNWNSGGFGGSGSIYNTVGAGVMTGVPDSTNNSDLRFTYGLQGSTHLGVKGLFDLNVDLDFGSREYSLLTRKQYVNESYALTAGIGGYSIGVEASRNLQIGNFRYGVDSIDGYLSGVPFHFKPLIQTPGSISSTERWDVNFGASLGLGVEGTLDFDYLIK
jgi:hypothetical protein